MFAKYVTKNLNAYFQQDQAINCEGISRVCLDSEPHRSVFNIPASALALKTGVKMYPRKKVLVCRTLDKPLPVESFELPAVLFVQCFCWSYFCKNFLSHLSFPGGKIGWVCNSGKPPPECSFLVQPPAQKLFEKERCLFESAYFLPLRSPGYFHGS